MKWFKHMANSRFDPKVMRLIRKHGLRGFGFYWAVVEAIAFQLDSGKPMPDLEETAHDMAQFFGEDTQLIEEIAQFCIKENLFERNPTNGRIMCMRLLLYLDNTMSVNPEIRNILSNFKKLEETSIPLKQIRLDKIRLDKIKEKINLPTLEEVTIYLTEKNITSFTAESFISYYTSKGWLVGKSPMKDWRAAVRTWVENDKKRNRPSSVADAYTIINERREP